MNDSTVLMRWSHHSRLSVSRRRKKRWMERRTKATGRRCLSSPYRYVQVNNLYVSVRARVCVFTVMNYTLSCHVSLTVVVLETLNSALQKQEALSANGKVRKTHTQVLISQSIQHLLEAH